MAVSQELFDAAVRHQVMLERLKAGEAIEVSKYLDRVDRLIERILSRWVDVDTLDEVSATEMEAAIRELRVKSTEIGAKAMENHLDRLGKLTKAEESFERLTLRETVAKAKLRATKKKALVNRMLKTPLQHDGGLLEPLLKTFNTREAKRVGDTLRQAWLNGDTLAQATRRLVGSKTRNKGAATAISRRHASSLAHTTMQHASSTARFATWEEHSDIVEGYRWVSTLDENTTATCKSLDGQVFKGKAAATGPRPPIHINCRSTTVAEISSAFDFLDEGATRAGSGADGATERGPLAADETYFTWLKRQPKAFQDEALGPKRGQLLRGGGLSAEEFRALQLDRNFQPLTLAEMKAKAPLAFEKAGLN
jgi:SPP1 gp7 family putative phage head morphogenesis protein